MTHRALDPMEKAMLVIAGLLTLVGALVVLNQQPSEPPPAPTVVRQFEDGSIVLDDGRTACLTDSPCDR